MVAIIATLIAAGLNILIIPVAQPGQTSNFNQAVNPSDVPRGVLAFTTFTAIVEHFISLIIFIVLLLDSMCVLWGPYHQLTSNHRWVLLLVASLQR